MVQQSTHHRSIDYKSFANSLNDNLNNVRSNMVSSPSSSGGKAQAVEVAAHPVEDLEAAVVEVGKIHLLSKKFDLWI